MASPGQRESGVALGLTTKIGVPEDTRVVLENGESIVRGAVGGASVVLGKSIAKVRSARDDVAQVSQGYARVDVGIKEILARVAKGTRRAR